MNLNKLNFIIFLIVFGYPLSGDKVCADVLPPVTLTGEAGGVCGGKEWKSSSLKDKINLVLYVDPDKQAWVKPLVARLDSIRYSPDLLGVTFVLNTDATLIPDFIIRNRVREKARTSENITYVLDRNKLLVRKWDLEDDNINILLFDASGQLIRKHHGPMTQQYMNNFIIKMNQSIKKGGLK